MSQILLDKIQNILDIDKTKSYIDQSLQPSNEFIDLASIFSDDDINNLMVNNKLQYTFRTDYESILEELSNIDNYEALNEFITKYEFNDLVLTFNPTDFDFNQVEIKSENIDSSSDELTNQKKLIQSTLMNENYLYNKKQIYDEIKQYLLRDLVPFRKLDNLAKKLFIETGKLLLKVSNLFIEGDINKNHIKAPLFLYDVEIEINENKLIITKKDELILNEKLIIFIAKELKIDYQAWDLKSIKSLEDFKSKFEPILKYEILDNDVLNGEQYSSGVYRTLKSMKYEILGIFDVKPGKIKEDFIQIMNQNIDLFKSKMIHDFDYYTQSEFIDNALVQINKPLNIYQKYAMRSAINENTLIYGPPGTGKSEIITSIIANLLINEKSILIVSEKDAALEVIKHRLNKLSKFAFYLKDIENENDFYEQIQSISSHMGSFYNLNESKFDMKNEYENNDRVIDYNLAIKRFREILEADINFSLEKDSRNNDYKSYLLSTKEVDKFVDNNGDNIKQYFEEYKDKFVKLQTPTQFIAKVAQYNDFREHYELTEEEVNKYEQYSIQINKFFAEYDNFDKKELIYENLEIELNELNDFCARMLLTKDRDFIDSITNDCTLLYHNWKTFKQIDDLLTGLDNKEAIIKFLIKNCARHDKFLATYLNTSKTFQKNLIKRYFYKNEISTKNMMFRNPKNSNFYDLFVRSVELFSKIKVFKNNQYLVELIKLDANLVEPLNVYLYTNDYLFKKPFLDYYANGIINFDNRIIKQYYKYRINLIERELININVYSSEKLLKNRTIIERDIPYLITRYLKDNRDFILNMDDAISETYLKFLKYKLSKLDSSLQQKMERMFQIIQMEVKPKINDFILEFIDCLRIIFPIWISKPELISFYTENKPELFDVGIFDEASQMFLERAYPMLYRCKQYIIAGDDKQLKPERLNFNQLDLDPSYRPLVNQIQFDYSESLLDRAKVSYWNTYSLRNHYRSQAKELIDFSNLYFYDNKLLFSTINNNLITLPLEIIDVKSNDSHLDSNLAQAKMVIDKINENLNKFVKILVICFTLEQKRLIQSLIKKENSLELDEKIKSNNLIIGDISSVQGDEGDLVIISTVFTRKTTDYGLIAQPRGMNYLNVAISRSKEKMIILKSINQNHIKLDLDAPFKDLEIFKKWIAYLDEYLIKYSSKNQIINRQELNLSAFKIDVYQTLVNHPWFKKIKMIQNLVIGTTKIDLAFYKKTINKISLVLILDDYKKNISIQSWFEDIDIEEYLKSRNYSLMRIREQDWLKNKDFLIDQIVNELDLKPPEELINPKSKKKKSKSKSTKTKKTKTSSSKTKSSKSLKNRSSKKDKSKKTTKSKSTKVTKPVNKKKPEVTKTKKVSKSSSKSTKTKTKAKKSKT